MLLVDCIVIESDGAFTIKTLSLDNAKEFLGYGHAHDTRLDIFVNFICADQVRIGRYTIKIENQMKLQRNNLVKLYDDFDRSVFNVLKIADLRNELSNEFIFEFNIAVEKAINNLYNEKIASRKDLSNEQKRAILRNYMNEFLSVPIDRAKTIVSALLDKILEEDLSKYQSGKKNILTYEFLETEGPDALLPDAERKRELKINLDKALTYIGIPNLFEIGNDYLSKYVRKNYDNFKANIEKTLRDIALMEDNKIYFKIQYWNEISGALRDKYFVQTFVIDFTTSGDEIKNDMNIKRLYSAILTRKVIHFYAKPPNSRITGTSLKVKPIAMISRYGCIHPLSLYEIALDKSIKDFFTSTKTPRYIIKKNNFFFLYGMDKYTFFDYYLRSNTEEEKFKILKQNLNIKEIEIDARNNEELQDFLKFYNDPDESELAKVEYFEEIFLEYYYWNYVRGRPQLNEYGTVDFKLSEDTIEIWNGEKYTESKFKDEYLLYVD